MSLIAAAPDLPLYLQMSRYTKGSKAVMELRTERFLQEQAASQSTASDAVSNTASDDTLITGSIGNADAETDEGGFSFDDFLDTINPLQHLPVISTLYREISGDQIEPAARIVGGAVFGGPIGAGLALADTIFEQASGANVGATIMSWLNGPNMQEATENATAGATQATTQEAEIEVPENVTLAATQRALPTAPPLSPEIVNALTALSSVQSDEEAGEEAGAQPTANFVTNSPVIGADSGPIDISAAMSAALERYSALNTGQTR